MGSGVLRTFVFACVISASVSAAGCAFVRGDFNGDIEPDRVDFIQKGETTRQDVAARLGAPDEVTIAGEREIHHYVHYRGKVGAFVPLLIVFSRVNVQSDDLYIFYEKDGIVAEVIYGNRTERMKFRWWPFGE
jgi:predicted secreted protein